MLSKVSSSGETMMSLCSTVTSSCSSHSTSQVLISAPKYRKEFEPRNYRHLNISKQYSSFIYRLHFPSHFRTSYRLKCAPSNIVSVAKEIVIDSVVSIVESPVEAAQIEDSTLPVDSISISPLNDTLPLVEPTTVPDELPPVEVPSGKLSPEIFPDASESLSSATATMDEVIHGLKDTVTESSNTINASIKSFTEGIREGIDTSLNKLLSAVNQSETAAGDSLNSVTAGLKDAGSKVSVVSLDLLRNAIVVAEDSLTKGASLIVSSYNSAKEFLPPQTKEAITSSEEKIVLILSPVATALQQGYAAVQSLERSVGLDPDDPIVSLSFLLGSSATLWVIYWVYTKGGYSGNLSPESANKLLSEQVKAALIDVREESLRESEGIPDLRRRARFRYASASLPEVDSSVKNMLKDGNAFENSLMAVIIRNLKVVEDRSKVIVMDNDGSRSKGIARSLRKLGIKQAYILEGGFQAWRKDGLRIKELKPETALTIIGEEAEAIIEDIKPSPAQAIGYGVALVAALYALTDLERSLEVIGVFGMGLSVILRVISYEKPEDFSEDIRVLMTPVTLGAQAVSWAAGKVESNGNGLPTAPSSSDVKNRVLQAAAKHESQPPDSDGLPTQITLNENKDL